MEKLIQYATKSSYYDGKFGCGDGWIAAGMGYLAKTKNGRLIAIDGGFPEDAEDFVKLLSDYSDGTTPEVELWIITHPHIDHYGVVRGITESKELSKKVKIKQILCLFEKEFAEIEEDDFVKDGIAVLGHAIDVTGAELITPKEGDEICIDGANIKILSLPEFTMDYGSPNYLSIIFMLTLGETKILFTGDATSERLEKAATLGDALKCDILQMPHHGLCDTGDIDFYKAAGAKTVLVPICKAGDRSMKSGYYGDAVEANEYAEANAEKIYRSYEGTLEIPFE